MTECGSKTGVGLELLFLGTGTSTGVPMIGCDCPTCVSDDPHDSRDRPSVVLRYPDRDAGITRDLLIDTTPDLRQQAIREGMTRCDGVFYTHAHADHIFGLDDLRRFNAVMQTPIDIYAEADTITTIRRIFPYIFEPHTNVNTSYVAQLIVHEIKPDQAMAMYGAMWTPLRVMHGRMPILGYRIDFEGVSIAYCTDVSTIPPQTYPQLQGVDVLVIDALRYRHHPTHMTVDQALAVIDQVQPKQAYFTHITHDILHADLSSRLPAGVALAHDGLHLTF